MPRFAALFFLAVCPEAGIDFVFSDVPIDFGDVGFERTGNGLRGEILVEKRFLRCAAHGKAVSRFGRMTFWVWSYWFEREGRPGREHATATVDTDPSASLREDKRKDAQRRRGPCIEDDLEMAWSFGWF